MERRVTSYWARSSPNFSRGDFRDPGHRRHHRRSCHRLRLRPHLRLRLRRRGRPLHELGADMSGGRRHVIPHSFGSMKPEMMSDRRSCSASFVVLFEQIGDGFRVLGDGLCTWLIPSSIRLAMSIRLRSAVRRYPFPHVHADGIGHATNLDSTDARAWAAASARHLRRSTFSHDKVIGIRAFSTT